MNFRGKNAVAISLVVIVALAVVAGVVVTAVGANRAEVDNDLFIDSAPVNYKSPENVIHINNFKEAVKNYVGAFSEILTSYFEFPEEGETTTEKFADRLLYALSVSRVPAYKLSGMATALNDNRPADVISGIDFESLNGMTEDELTDAVSEILSHTSFELFGSFLDSFFSESLLTGEEFGEFLYTYIDTYGSGVQREAMRSLGKELFIKAVGSIGYATTAFHGAESGAKIVDETAFSEAFYQLGSVMTEISSDPELFEKAFGLFFTFENSEDWEVLEPLCEKLQGKTGEIIEYIGLFMREIDPAIIESYMGKENVDKAVYYSETSKALKRAGEKFSEEIGADDLTAFVKDYFSDVINLYNALYNGVDYEEEWINEGRNVIDDFYSTVEFFADAEMTYEKAAELTEEELKLYIKNGDAFKNFVRVADRTFITVLYLWTSKRGDEAKGGEI